jgi:GNAT superfamily N-acetyltransferase
MTVTLREFRLADDAAARGIYESSFPTSLRAPWSDLTNHRADERLLILVEDDSTVLGTALIRRLGGTDMVFVRYLAIDPSRRNQGLGEALVSLLRDRVRAEGGCALLLDVEEPIGPHAADDRRRISFYERCGLSLLDVPGYAPPEHGETGEIVPLLLMGQVLDDGPPLVGDRLADAVRAVLVHRYGVDP